jgi:hypothetical protein
MILALWIVLAYIGLAADFQTQVTRPLFYVGVALGIVLGVYQMIQRARDRRPPEQ